MVIIVEGFFDAAKVWQAGNRNVVALMGSSLSEVQAGRLQNRFHSAVLMLDGDTAGLKGTASIAECLSHAMEVSIIRLPDGRQPDQIRSREINEALQPHSRYAHGYGRQTEGNLHHSGAGRYNEVVQSQRKSQVKRTARSVRQSVTMPAHLAREVRRVAKEHKVTMSRALVSLAEKGVEAEAEARAKLATTYEQFMATDDPKAKSAAGKELIKAIFGRDAIAEDSLR
jgi:DNA primase